MKKTVGIIIALGLAVGLVMLLLPSQQSGTSSKETTINVAQYLPPDTLLVGTVSNIKNMVTEIPKSPIGRLFGKETVHAMMQEMQASPNDIAEYDNLHKKINKFFNNPSFTLLFGDTFTFAVLPMNLDTIFQEEKETQAEPEELMGKYFVAITTTTSPATLNAFSSLVENIRVTQEQIDGLDMLKIAQANEDIAFYAYIDGNNVLLSLSPGGIKACLANKEAGTLLTQSPGFAKAEQYWADYPDNKTYFRFFLNMNAMLDMLNKVQEPEIKKALADPEFKQIVDLYQGLDYMFGVTYTTSKALESQYALDYDPARLHPDMKLMLSQKADKNPYLFLLNNQPLMYAWGTPLELSYLFNVFSSDPYMMEEMENAIKEVSGLTVKEFSHSLGPQYGFTLDSIVDSGLFPIPKVTFWIETRDKALVEKALAHLTLKTKEAGQPPTESKENGTSYLTWSLMPGDAGQPSVSIHNNTLYLTSSTQGMKAILNNTATPTQMPSVTIDKLGKELADKIASANSSVAIIYPGEIAPPLLSLIDFFNNYAAGGAIATHTLKKELGIFMKSMDYMAGYCNTSNGRVSCTSTLKWSDTPVEN